MMPSADGFHSSWSGAATLLARGGTSGRCSRRSPLVPCVSSRHDRRAYVHRRTKHHAHADALPTHMQQRHSWRNGGCSCSTDVTHNRAALPGVVGLFRIHGAAVQTPPLIGGEVVRHSNAQPVVEQRNTKPWLPLRFRHTHHQAQHSFQIKLCVDHD